MNEKRIYLGNAKKTKEFEWGSISNGAVSMDGLKELYEKFGFTSQKTGKKYLPVTVVISNKEDNYGNTISIQVNTFKPDPEKKSSEPSQPAMPTGGPDMGDVPF